MTTEALKKAHEAVKAKREAGIPVIVRSKSEIFASKPTRKAAIDLWCTQCMGGEKESGIRTLIRDCTCGPESALPCPFYDYRPYK